jgi:hypothetical protein
LQVKRIQQRKLRNGNLEVSALGLGCMGMRFGDPGGLFHKRTVARLEQSVTPAC